MTGGIGEYQILIERLIDLEVGIDTSFSFVVLKTPIARTSPPLKSLVQL